MDLKKFYKKRISICFIVGLISEMTLLLVAVMFVGNTLLWFGTTAIMVFIGILYAKLIITNSNNLKEVKNDLRTMRTSTGND